LRATAFDFVRNILEFCRYTAQAAKFLLRY